ncbi:hypothetical protein A2W24_04860 [Microgenomates group bacterium RBG_16_45_19]|nr:MAG: hypothetical protein A2W24_04860 [Microgenomates group bacterium RBG_16_45_19]
MTLLKPWWFWLIWLALAISLRWESSRWVLTHFTPDSRYYLELATNLATGKGFSLDEPTAQRPVHEHTPGYPLFLALIFKLVDSQPQLAETNRGVLGAIGVQSGLSLITAWLIAAACLRLTKDIQSARIILALGWLFPSFIISAHYLLSETWGLFLMAGFVWGLSQERWRQSRGRLVVLGLVFGLMSLVRPALLVLLPAYGIWLGWFGQPWVKQRLWVFKYLLLGVLTPLIIWIARTYVTTGYLVPVQVGVGQVFLSGACPTGICQVGNLRQHWWWYSVKKAADFQAWPYGWVDLRAYRTMNQTGAKGWLGWHYLLLIGAAAGGGWALRRKGEISLWVVWWLAGSVTHQLMWSEARYALPYWLLIMPLAVLGWLTGWRKRRQMVIWWGKRWGWLGLMLVLAIYIWLPESDLGRLVWPGTRQMAALIFWGVGLYGLGRGLFKGAKFTRGQGVIAGWWLLVIWGMMVGWWRPLRENWLPQAPVNDHLFPVARDWKF